MFLINTFLVIPVYLFILILEQLDPRESLDKLLHQDSLESHQQYLIDTHFDFIKKIVENYS